MVRPNEWFFGEGNYVLMEEESPGFGVYTHLTFYRREDCVWKGYIDREGKEPTPEEDYRAPNANSILFSALEMLAGEINED